MNIKGLLACFMVVFVLFSTTACREGESTGAPIGNWEIEKKSPSGEVIRVEMKITPDKKFSGVMLVDGVPAWTYGGTWVLNNDEFTYVYTESSKPLPENSDDTDIIISISETEYKYKSKLSGEVNTYRRMK